MSEAIVVDGPVPTGEVLTLSELKAYARITGSDDDPVLQRMIRAAIGVAESKIKERLRTTPLIWYLDAWPEERTFLRLPTGPTSAVASVKYYDASGTLQTMPASDYFVDLKGTRARIVLKEGATWPQLEAARPSAIEVRFTAGYANTNAIPDGVITWIALYVSTLSENREAFVTGTIVSPLDRDYVDGLLDPHTVTEFY